MMRRKRFHARGPAKVTKVAVAPGEPARPGSRDARAYWLYGRHAVAAALRNPRRRASRLLYLADSAPDFADILGLAGPRRDAGLDVEPTDRPGFERLLPGAVHQGVALRVDPLPEIDIADICDSLSARPVATVVLLDQVTDPHNVGAILRSAAAFGADAVVLTERHAAPESGVLAKAASGALDLLPLVRVTNLARAIETLKAAGFWCIGLAEDASPSLAEADLSGRIAFALGAEGEGLRRLTRERCDLLVRLPTGGTLASLNVSNAAAVALYELRRAAQRGAAAADADRPPAAGDRRT